MITVLIEVLISAVYFLESQLEVFEMTNKDNKAHEKIGTNMIKLLTEKEVLVVSGAKGPVPSGGNPTTNIPRKP